MKRGIKYFTLLTSSLLLISCFEADTTSLEKATILCNKFKQNNYNAYVNKKRGKLMLELIFIRKDIDGR